jgi:hypothetical protein
LTPLTSGEVMNVVHPLPMKTPEFVSLVMAGALAVSGCENMTPGENAGVAGGLAGAVTGIALGVSGVDPAISIPVAAGAGLVAGGAAYIVSKQQATARQRQIAKANAQAAVGKWQAQQPRQTASASKKAPAKKPRFIAVDTEKTGETPKGAAPVMVYDTQTNQIVGNNVYNLGQKPKVGSNTSYDTMTAQYVGTGRSM